MATNLTIQASGTSGPNGTGTPSEIDLSHVTTLTGTTDNVYFFNAYSGGEIDLSNLASNPSGRNWFQVSGAGSVLDLSSLPSVVSDQASDSQINIGSGGTVLDPLLTTLDRTDLNVDGQATIATARITSITGSQVSASDGAVIAFPGVTALATFDGGSLTIEASGTSGTGTPSEIDLSHVTMLTGTTDNVYFFNAYSGGEIDLSNLASNPSGRNWFQVSGAGSVLDLSSLPSVVSDQASDSQINIGSGGTVLDPLLTTLDRTDLNVDGQATIATARITSITGSQVSASDGAVIAFPGVTALATFDGGSLTIEASGTSGTGTPSEIDLSHVTTLTGTTDNVYFFNAYSGGKVDLSGLTSNPSGRNWFQVSGAGSVLDLSSLPGIVSDQGNSSEINADSSGTVLLNSSTVSLSQVAVSVTNGATIEAGTLRFLPGSSLSGDGTIEANVVNVGVINLGANETGVLTIDGDFTQYGAGVLNIQIGGTTVGTQYNQLAVTGGVELSGTIAILLANGFRPQVGNQFSVIKYASRSGEFSTYNGLNYASGDTFQTDLQRRRLHSGGRTGCCAGLPDHGPADQQGGRRDEFHGRPGHSTDGQRHDRPFLEQPERGPAGHKPDRGR